MRVHKILFAFLVLIFIAQAPRAQTWQYNGGMATFNGGNVGIGTTTPGHKLSIQAASGNAVDMALTNTDGTSLLSFATDASALPTISSYYGLTFNAVNSPFYSFKIAGTEYFRINQQGQVGIGGVSNPLAPVHIYGGITANNGASVIYDKGDMSNQFYCAFYGNALQQAFIGTPANVSNRLDLGTGNTTIAMTLLNNNIGIGTTNPACRLHVSGGTLAASSDDALSGFVQLWADNAVIFKSGNANGLRFGTATDLSAANWSEKMRITTAGYVGIGTLNPTEALEVAGNIKSAGFVLPTGAAAGKVLTSDANGNATWQTASGGSATGWGLGGNSVASLTTIGTTSNYDLPVITNNTERMRIGANGNVGIGTTNINDAGYKLFVEGNIRTRKVRVDQDTWADYVFDNNYQLRPLQEVEQYIQQQHHLPEVPSAKEVKKEGLDLGDNQATLLKKIEELTLYMIEQNKKQEEQQELIKKLNNLVESQQKRISTLEKQRAK